MRTTRVLVANRPRLIRDLLLSTIADQPDILVVGEVEDDAELPRAVDETHPDILIITLEKPNERPSMCDFILERHPRIRILALAPGSGSSIFYRAHLAIHADPIETSEEGVLTALRNRLGAFEEES